MRGKRPADSYSSFSLADFTWKESLLKIFGMVGFAMLVPSSLVFFWLVHRGSDSPIMYLVAAIMYAAVGMTLFALVIRWTDD
jgi:hypothetical protein